MTLYRKEALTMADISHFRAQLERNGFETSFFETAQEAADYLDGVLDGKTIGIGGSLTVQELGLYPRLAAHNTVHWHWEGGSREDAATAQVYLSSVNGAAESGELINIDGSGNRVASTLFGHEALYLILGVNKLAPDYDAALWRARNIAAPKNAQRLKRNTPCALRGDQCYNCSSPERICRGLTVLWQRPTSLPRAEVVIINQALGY